MSFFCNELTTNGGKGSQAVMTQNIIRHDSLDIMGGIGITLLCYVAYSAR